MQTAVEIKNVFEEYLKRSNFNGDPQTLYDPINYILSLKAKRARPVMLLLGCQLFDSQIESALPAGLAIEVFHNFTLLHDDIIDDAPIRRGHDAVHIKFGTNKAILAGDAMMVLANKLLNTVQTDEGSYISKQFNKAALAICEGQQLDTDFETSDDVTIEDYIEMIRKKTAVLLGVSLEIGALIGGASREDAKRLYQFGEQFGISFQIQDDLLDAFGDQEKVGKQTGGDILQGKKTYLYLKALDLLEGQEKLDFIDAYSSKDELGKVEKIKAKFKSIGADEYSRQLRDAYHDLAFSHLNQSHHNQEAIDNLVEYSNLFIARES